MIIKISFEYDLESDGIEYKSSSEQKDVFDLEELSGFLTSAVQGAGWNYVTCVGIEKDDGSVVFYDN